MKLHAYLSKMRGSTRGSPPRVSNSEVIWSWIGAFPGIMTVAWVEGLVLTGTDLTLMIGSDQIHALGYVYVLIPATVGPLLLLLIALLVNNIPESRR